MRPKQRRRVSWSEAPPELLQIIAKKSSVSRNDVINFRRVCKSWRRSAPLSLFTSKPILSPIFPRKISCLCTNTHRRRSRLLVANSVFLVKSTVNSKLKPWLLSVEESKPGILSIRSPLSRIVTSDLPEEFPKELNLCKFDLLKLGNFHTYKYFDRSVAVDDVNDVIASRLPTEGPYVPVGNKVVLFPNPNCENSDVTIDECKVVELTNSVLIDVRRVNDGTMENQAYFRGRRLEDIINYKGKIYGIDRKGRVCSMDYHTLKMTSVMDDPLCEGTGSDNKKRLAVSGDELYLVYTWTTWCRKGSQSYKVFRLNEEDKKWDKLDGIGDDRILFVTFDGSFFASKKDFPGWKGNCVISVKGSFPTYAGTGFSNVESQRFEVESDCISAFHFEGGDFGPLDGYPGYSEVLWPPPSWLWRDNCEIEEAAADDYSDEDEDEEVEEVEEGGGGTEQGNEQPSGEEEGNKEGGEEVDNEERQQEIPENQVHAAKGTQNVQEDIAHEDFDDQNNVDSAVAMNSLLKVAENEVAPSKFLGVDVSSHSIPILQKIWDKHGNIMEGHVVNSDSLLTWALESLAKTIIILQNNSGRSLDESQAKFLKSILLDFGLMHFKIDWLVPFVDKALALHKNKVIMELEMAKLKLQTELCEVEERLAAQGKLVPESQLVSLDLKDVLN